MAATLGSAWREAALRLECAGVETPALDARLLLEAAAGVSRLELLADPERPLSETSEGAFLGLVERRARREPVSRILGRKAFWTLELGLRPGVLTPRPETETLVEAALAAMPRQEPAGLLDLGVGSGAILLALLAERPLAFGVGVDLADDALAVASDNAGRCRLSARAAFVRSDWATAIADRSFDIAVANPPYVASGDIDELAPEARDFEPLLAIDGGADGLCAYRALAGDLVRVLRPGGSFFLEVGAGQSRAVAEVMAMAGAVQLESVRDLGGLERVVSGKSPPDNGPVLDKPAQVAT
ncbi:MAG TPA: peptide chain release factor N(5)-glutamine methyltransferase [Caulobacteraceae bacterium]|nr:peptide chain release factor N(5)-glutamine methyltransferase [Caulobacteraceae bacterium]